MPTGLYSRVQGRGFPSTAAAGLTGAGALESQGGPADPAHGESVNNPAPSTLRGYAPDTVAPVSVVLLEGAWGLPGESDPDHTPRGHASPVPGWAGSYDDPELLQVRANSAELHSVDFGTLASRVNVHGVQGHEPVYDRWTSNDPGTSPLQKLDGQIRAMGGRDDIQGYGLRNGYGFDAGHRDRIVDTVPQPFSYLDPAERVFIVPQASGSFTPTDEVQGPQPWTSALDASGVNYTAPTTYTPSPDPDTLSSQLPGGAASAGWWG